MKSVFIREEKERRPVRGECHVTVEAKIGVMHLQAEEHREL